MYNDSMGIKSSNSLQLHKVGTAYVKHATLSTVELNLVVIAYLIIFAH